MQAVTLRLMSDWKSIKQEPPDVCNTLLNLLFINDDDVIMMT